MQGNILILATGSKSNPLMTFLPLIVIVGAFYFFLIRPQRAKQRQQQELQRNLEPGTQVVTTSGMYATIVETNDDGVVLEIAPGVQAQFVAQAIMKVIPDDIEEADDEQAEDDGQDAPVGDVEAKTDTPSLLKSDDKSDNKTDGKA